MPAAAIWVLWTVLMGNPHGMAVFKSEAECQNNLAIQKAAKILDTSQMKCVAYVRKE